MRHTIQLLSIAACGIACFAASPTEEQAPLPTTIFIVRHGEKDAQENLNLAGSTRANTLRDLMVKQSVGAVYSTPTPRTIGTAQPTATDAEVILRTYNAADVDKQWAATVVKRYAGKSVLIVGHSNTVLPTIKSFGAKIDYKLAYNEYDNMFIVRVQNGTAQVVRINYGQPSPDPAPTTVPSDSKAKMKAPAQP